MDFMCVQGQEMPAAQLQPLVFEQWLMADLRELGATCLQADLAQSVCTEIVGPVALQVNQLISAPNFNEIRSCQPFIWY
jgi:hypothetical protein